MADRYLVHGLYGSASFVASTTNNSSSLNVTAVVGRIAPGSVVTGPNIPNNTVITSYGTGRGGTGTYTMSATATATASGQLMTSINGHVSLDPEWGVAQEGDGTGKDAATPATVSIDLSAYTAAAGATIAIGGATLTCVASGAGNNQFNAGTGTTLINNIVTAINRTSNTVTVNAAAAGWATPKVQDAVFARRNGNNLEIMTRAGSATYNANSSFKVVTTGLTGGSQIDQTFSGGAGGAWGYIVNPVQTSHPSALGSGVYGFFGSGGPFAGTISGGDVVYFRAARKFTAYANSFTMGGRAMGSLASPVLVVIDDGTQWPVDGLTPVLTLEYINPFNSPSGLVLSATNQFVDILGARYSDGTFNLQFCCRIPNGALNVGIGGNCRASIKNFSMYELSGNAAELGTVIADNSYLCELSSFSVSSSKNNNRFFSASSSSRSALGRIRDFVFDASGSSAASNGAMAIVGLPNAFSIQCLEGRFKDFVIGSELMATPMSSGFGMVSFDNVDFGGVTRRGPYLAANSETGGNYFGEMHISSLSRVGLRDFWRDDQSGYIEWNSQRSQPTCGAVLDDGVTTWSIGVFPTTLAGNIPPGAPLELPRLVKVNTLADGARTFKLRFVAEQALAVNRARVSMMVSYVDVNGSLVVLDTYDPFAGAIASDSTTWTNESGGFVTYQNGGTVNHHKYVLTVSTPSGKNLKNGVEVGVVARIHLPGSTLAQSYFFDPDFTIE